MRNNYRLVLASSSPRRKEILEKAGFSIEIVDPGEVESAIADAPTPEALAIAKAQSKAMAVAALLTPPYPAIVIGADTLVALDDDILGKPLDRFDAISILTRLSGTRHRVISGLCLWPVCCPPLAGMPPSSKVPRLDAVCTWVKMRRIGSDEIKAYVASGESDGKAGAYAVQETGDRFVEKIEGSFLNVVGFPLERFQELLARSANEWRMP